MRNIIIAVFLLSNIKIAAQSNGNPRSISKTELIGTWQRDSNIIGNGLSQNFVFRNNGSFVLNIGTDRDDVVSTIKLKGKYRLYDNKIYFTILSRTVVEGSLETGGPGVTSSIFEFGANSSLKEIKESNSKELQPCYLTIIQQKKIKINAETYYKVE